MEAVREETVSGERVLTVEDGEAGIAFSVAPGFGGELSSLRARRAGRWVELLHRAGRFEPPRATMGPQPIVTAEAENGPPRAWRGRAPWLFPAVGRNYAPRQKARLSYVLDGAQYPMPCHGFVMERAWERAPGPAAACRTAGDASTKEYYPFDFELTAAYSLIPGGVSARVEVAAARSNRSPMPFSLGNHITLAVPFGGADAGACVVRSPARERQLLSPRGLLTGESVPADYREGRALRDEPGLADMVLGGFAPGEAWAEVVDPAAFGVRVAQRELVAPGGAARTRAEQFRFVFYADAARSFFCPEPWYGAPDSLNTGLGLVRLEPGARFAWEMAVTVL